MRTRWSRAWRQAVVMRRGLSAATATQPSPWGSCRVFRPARTVRAWPHALHRNRCSRRWRRMWRCTRTVGPVTCQFSFLPRPLRHGQFSWSSWGSRHVEMSVVDAPRAVSQNRAHLRHSSTPWVPDDFACGGVSEVRLTAMCLILRPLITAETPPRSRGGWQKGRRGATATGGSQCPRRDDGSPPSTSRPPSKRSGLLTTPRPRRLLRAGAMIFSLWTRSARSYTRR